MTKFFKKYSLKDLNTFGVNSTAAYFYEFESEEELISLLAKKKIEIQKILTLGGGSNVLFVSDYDGTILKNKIMGVHLQKVENENFILSVGAGENWDDVVHYAVKNNLYGIENLSLIPGSVGAAPIQNIGAYGVELKDVFHSVEGICLESLQKKIITKEECNFGYRDSIFKRELKGKFIITKVNLILSKMNNVNLTYSSLKNYLTDKKISKPTLRQIREAVIKIRNSKLPDPKLIGNAGSFFKNPTVTEVELEKLKTIYPDISFFLFNENTYKISAGWLIEKCGLKGKRVGNVGTHKDQALVIVNYGGATGNEILNFAKNIQKEVFDEFGILLNPEVNIINHSQRELL